MLQCSKEPTVSSKTNLVQNNSDQDVLVNQETETESQTIPVESPLLLLGDSVDDFCQVDVAETILKHSNEMLNVLERINTTNDIIYLGTIDQQLICR